MQPLLDSNETAAIQARTGALKDSVAALVSASAELRAYGLDDWAGETLGEREIVERRVLSLDV